MARLAGICVRACVAEPSLLCLPACLPPCRLEPFFGGAPASRGLWLAATTAISLQLAACMHYARSFATVSPPSPLALLRIQPPSLPPACARHLFPAIRQLWPPGLQDSAASHRTGKAQPLGLGWPGPAVVDAWVQPPSLRAGVGGKREGICSSSLCPSHIFSVVTIRCLAPFAFSIQVWQEKKEDIRCSSEHLAAPSTAALYGC